VAILGVNYAPENTGIAPYTAGIAEGLRSRGHAVQVFTSFPHYPDWRVSESDRSMTRTDYIHGIRVKRLRHYVPGVPTGARRALFEASFGARLAAARLGDPDVVLCVSPALISTGMVVAKLRAKPRRPSVGLIVQDLYSKGVQETGLGGGRLASLARAAEARVAGASDGVAVIHDRFRDQVVSSLGVPRNRVRVIRNWTHVDEVPEFDVAGFRSTMGWRSDEIIVLHAGAMGAKQALENVVDAGKVADQHRKSVRFVLLGGGSKRSSLEAAAAGVESIQFLDQLSDEDFGKALRSADVLLVNERPGVIDMAVPSKLTSYFSAARPVLAATDEESTTAEELTRSGAGVRVDAGKPDELLDAALRLSSDVEAAKRLGENGLRYCKEVLSKEAALDAYDAWVRELAEAKR
jgi:colanic acid biosynthesis glycosyl transferase WcaI